MQTPGEFISKWKASTLKERSASQEHFLDLCRLIGHPTPAQSDPTGEHFTFERGASKTGSGQGWADVWKKGYFAWEYKGTRTKREFTKMAKAPIQQFNTQDQQLNEARKEGKVVTIRFLDGNELAGIVSAFDQFWISFLVPNPMMDLMIYKHSIAYIKFPQ